MEDTSDLKWKAQLLITLCTGSSSNIGEPLGMLDNFLGKIHIKLRPVEMPWRLLLYLNTVGLIQAPDSDTQTLY